MKKKNVILVLFLALLLVFLSGCAAQATITGGPTIDVPPPPTGGKSGVLGKIFSPNNMAVFANSTEFLIVLNETRIPFDQRETRLLPGQIVSLPWRNYQGTGRVVVMVSAYNPLTGEFMGTTSENFYLTDNGGHPRMYDRVIRSRLTRGNRVIYISNQ